MRKVRKWSVFSIDRFKYLLYDSYKSIKEDDTVIQILVNFLIQFTK